MKVSLSGSDTKTATKTTTTTDNKKVDKDVNPVNSEKVGFTPPKKEQGSWAYSLPNFSSTNAQSDGVHSLKRIEFEFQGKSYKFIMNPEQYTQTEPGKAQVTQTKSGGWIDDFGAGINAISIKGTTGLGRQTSSNLTGFNKFKELRDIIRKYYYKAAPGTDITTDKELIFHNYTDGEDWIVVPKVFSLFRSINRPLLYLYDIQLVCIRPANQPQHKSPPPMKPTIQKI